MKAKRMTVVGEEPIRRVQVGGRKSMGKLKGIKTKKNDLSE